METLLFIAKTKQTNQPKSVFGCGIPQTVFDFTSERKPTLHTDIILCRYNVLAKTKHLVALFQILYSRN